MSHTRGQPYHPMTQGKIERYHLSLTNRILRENYYLPGHLEARLAEFVDFYNTRRYHEPGQSHSRRYLLRAWAADGREACFTSQGARRKGVQQKRLAPSPHQPDLRAPIPQLS